MNEEELRVLRAGVTAGADQVIAGFDAEVMQALGEFFGAADALADLLVERGVPGAQVGAFIVSAYVTRLLA